MGAQHKVGLVLSGGGIKGAAHIGMLKALKKHNIEPTIVAGTSAGAIVGAMYTANLDEETMLDYFTGTGIFNPVNYTWKKPGLINTDALEKVLLKIFPENSFEALHRPLHIVATLITLARQKVFSSGELVKPLLASACFPVVFAPESLNSYNTFDMFKIKEVYEKGYEDALKVLSKVKDLSQFQLDDKNGG